MIDLTGQTLGQYQILEQIGEGGMATVYKAYQPSLDRYVAIKILPPYFMHEPGFAERFEREAKAIAQLVHPNILPIYDFGREGDLSYIVMRYVDAGTLKNRMAQPLPLSEIVRVIDDLASALDYAHQQGVIHRDVKPGNVLIDERGWVLLSDFGLAKMVEGSVALTGSGVGVGTPAYMSPEQGQGIKVDHRADVYSLGVMLYEMVVGQVPYDAETPFAIVLKHIADPLPLPRRVNPNVPEGVERVILKAMAKNPDDRFDSAGDLASALRAAVAATPGVPAGEAIAPVAGVPTGAVEAPIETALVEPPPPTVVEPAAPTRRPLWLWVGAGVLALILVVGAIALLTAGEEEAQTTPTSVAQVEANETPTRVEATEAPAGGETPSPQLVEAALPPDLLIPPQQGQILFTCEDDPQQICIYNVNPSQLADRISVNMEVGYPTWSPTGDQILFHTTGKDGRTDLWLVSRDGSNLRALTDVPGVNEEMAAWSPDDKWIAFHRNGGLYLIRPDGQELREIPLPEELQGCIYAPAWSPDGKELAFLQDDHECGDREDGQPIKMRLVAIERDGSRARPLAGWETSNLGDIRVAWSPDGQFVAYQPEAEQEWLLARTDGSGKLLTIGQAPEWWFSNFWPRWGGPPPPIAGVEPPAGGMLSPEGTIVEDCETAKGQICLRGPDDRVQAIPIDQRFWFRSPGWSPDGQQIVVSASDRGDPYGEGPAWAPGDLYILDATCFDQPGACADRLRRITSSEDNDIQPAWSPDGEWIAFHRNGDLVLVRPDPDNPEITPFNFDMTERCALKPAWSPDSRQIAFFNIVGGCEQEPPFDLEVRVVGVDGADDHAIWREQMDSRPWSVAWSPDGQAVAANVNLGGKPRWLLISPTDGTVSEMPFEPIEWLPEYWPPWGGKAALVPPFEVSVEGEHSPVIPLDEANFEMDDGGRWQATSDDPTAVFGGQAVAFLGLEKGGMNPVVRYRITFDQEVDLTGVTLEFAGSQNTNLRLYDSDGNEVAAVGPFHYGNAVRQERLNAGTTHGREFFLQIENDICCWFGVQNVTLEVMPPPPPGAEGPPPLNWEAYDEFNGDRLDTDERWLVPRRDLSVEVTVADSRLVVQGESDTDQLVGYPLISKEDAPVMGVEATVGLDAAGEAGGFVGVTLLGEGDEFWLLALAGPNGDVLLHHGQGEQSLSTEVVARADCCPGEHRLSLRVEGDRLLAGVDDEIVAEVELPTKPRRFGISIGLPPGATLSVHVNEVFVAIAR